MTFWCKSPRDILVFGTDTFGWLFNLARKPARDFDFSSDFSGVLVLSISGLFFGDENEFD